MRINSNQYKNTKVKAGNVNFFIAKLPYFCLYICYNKNIMKKIFAILVIITAACNTTQKTAVMSPGSSNLVSNGKMFATIYQQKSAEYRALCLQAFNIAHLRIDAISSTQTSLPKVIVTDIDETILNNSPFEAHQTLQGKDYDAAAWAQWAAMASADTVPGSLSFLQYASSKGIEIFYVTNRGESEKELTLKNLQKFNFPNSDNAHLFPLQNTSSKETRRQSIAASHDIVMLMGDNLGDFSSLFDRKNLQDRRQNTDAVAAQFGDRFIVLPNPAYGDWESSLYQYKVLTPAQKDSLIRASLDTY
jgi:5'-nucleotidase (lipoprotein e(P4) family)